MCSFNWQRSRSGLVALLAAATMADLGFVIHAATVIDSEAPMDVFEIGECLSSE
ncbi:hypothetical protein [Paraburkholderia fynbosensis]|uniref:hypothetical protein n=1 Tax=Paraburkholderia fynbosensis TaxID=1200993 RepID=UPI00158352A6|nr:hypothetical protein [Paraburkholderia fynbosensis]